MTHRVSHKRLSRDTNARRALLKNLATSLVLHERIVTTTAKAKSVRPVIEKLVTKAKNDTIIARRYLKSRLDKESAVNKMLELIGPTFKERPGGYTRILKLGQRPGDRAETSLIEFVENVSEVAAKKKIEEKKNPKKPTEQIRAKKDEKKAEVKIKAKTTTKGKAKPKAIAKKEKSAK